MIKKLTAAIVVIAYLIIAPNCSPGKKATGSAPVESSVSFDKDVMPIMRNSCTPCHFPPDGKKEPLDSYDAVKKNIGHVIERVKLPPTDIRFMPFKSKKPALSDSAINVLEQWEKQGMAK